MDDTHPWCPPPPGHLHNPGAYYITYAGFLQAYLSCMFLATCKVCISLMLPCYVTVSPIHNGESQEVWETTILTSIEAFLGKKTTSGSHFMSAFSNKKENLNHSASKSFLMCISCTSSYYPSLSLWISKHLVSIPANHSSPQFITTLQMSDSIYSTKHTVRLKRSTTWDFSSILRTLILYWMVCKVEYLCEVPNKELLSVQLLLYILFQKICLQNHWKV